MPAPRSRWRTYLLLGVIALVLCLLASGWAYYYFGGPRELAQAIAETDRLDPGWRLDDLIKRQPQNEENGILQIMAAKRLLPKHWPDWPVPQARGNLDYARDLKSDITSSLLESPAPTQLNEPLTSLLRGELQRASAALAEADKLAGMTKGSFPIPPSARANFPRLEYESAPREIAGLLQYDAIFRIQEQDYAGAATTVSSTARVP